MGVLHSYLKENKASKKVQQKIREYSRKLNIRERDSQYRDRLNAHMEILKQKLAVLGSRLRRYHKRTQRYRQNNHFNMNQRGFFRGPASLHSEEAIRYWSEEKSHNTNATWIKFEKDFFSDLPEMPSITITKKAIGSTIKRMKNWTAAGIDGMHNFWWKSLPSTHGVLAHLFHRALEDPNSITGYFTHGMTHTILKKGDRTKPNNYRPITYLSSVYKIYTSKTSQQIRLHLSNNHLLAWLFDPITWSSASFEF